MGLVSKMAIREGRRGAAAFRAWRRSRPPRASLDDAQRVVLGTLGGGLMLGGIAWAGTVSAIWPLRALPALLMFVVGGVLLLIALRGRQPDPRRESLDKAITDGRALQRYMPTGPLMAHNIVGQWEHWEGKTFAMLRDHFGLAAVQDFLAARAGGTSVAEWVTKQVAFLEALAAK
jgi:hypothetical protein